jgi:predicted Rossmann fold nucleotide-binding protein DprA/Smf involved in DNA uptake
VPVVSGGARGIDQAAMQGALACGGPVTAVLADSLERSTLDREHRRLLLDGQLTLVSPFDPNAGFNVGNAMQRNKMVYALADAALVVNSDVGKGGTWAGAVEQLTKLRLVPLFVRSTGAPSPGLQALMGKGALPWPNPRDDAELRTLLRARSTQPESPPAIQAPFPLASEAAKATTEDDLYGAMLRRLQELFLAPKKESEVAAALGIEKKRLRAVLERLVQEGALMRSSKTRAFVYKGPMLFPDVKPATVPDPV